MRRRRRFQPTNWILWWRRLLFIPIRFLPRRSPLGVRSHLVLRRILSKITPALKTRISPIYTKALTVSVLAQLRGHSCNSCPCRRDSYKDLRVEKSLLLKQLRHKWIETRVSRIHTNWISRIRDSSWNSCRAFVYFMSTRESQQSDNATRFRYRQESQQY